MVNVKSYIDKHAMDFPLLCSMLTELLANSNLLKCEHNNRTCLTTVEPFENYARVLSKCALEDLNPSVQRQYDVNIVNKAQINGYMYFSTKKS